jgi:hypothetical protein
MFFLSQSLDDGAKIKRHHKREKEKRIGSNLSREMRSVTKKGEKAIREVRTGGPSMGEKGDSRRMRVVGRGMKLFHVSSRDFVSHM